MKLPVPLFPLLAADLPGLHQGKGEDGMQVFVAADLAGDIADRTAEPGAQELQLAIEALGLPGVAIRPAIIAAFLATLVQD